MKKHNRGGARNGAGRPKVKKEYSDEFKTGILKALSKQAKKSGKTIYEVFADRIFDRRTRDTTFVKLMEILVEIMVIRESVHESHKYEHGPTLYLPETQEKPKEFKEMEDDFKSKLTH